MPDSYVALDVEATGMDPSRHEIIEVAAIAFDVDGEIDRFSSLVRPRSRLSLDIATLTGIRQEELQAAPTLGDITPRLRQLLAGRPIVGHSVGMDVAMLDAAGLVLPNPVYDTFQLATLLLSDMPSFSLAAVAARLDVPASPGHRALDDAATSAGVFRSLIQELEQYDASTLDQVASYARVAGWPTAQLFTAMADRRFRGPLFTQAEHAGRGPHELAFLAALDRPDPLRPTGSTKRIDPDVVAGMLAVGGPLSDVVPHYEYRRQQEAMANGVARALDDDGQLVVEAGTGTGKSVAYLLPAALYAAERGEPVVVSTNTLALQDQLFRKDIPDLQRALAADGESPPFRAAVLKGRTNYLCLRRWFTGQRQPTHDPVEAQLRAKVLLWLGTTETGDRAELRLDGDEEALWRHLAEEENACVASRCVYQQRNQCFLYRARRRAEHAHVVVVNHALLLSDAVAGSRVLPEYDRLIVDEAHHLEEQATTQFGFSVDQRAVLEQLDAAVRDEGAVQSGTVPTVVGYLGRMTEDNIGKRRASAALDRLAQVNDLARATRSEVADLFSRLREVALRDDDDRGGFGRTLRVTRSVRGEGSWVETELVWERLDRRLRDLEGQIRWYLEALERLNSDESDEADAQQREDLIVALGVSIRGLSEVAVKLQSAVGTPDPGAVYWIERSASSGEASVHAAPLHVGQVLQEQLFSRLRSLVLTSATMTTDGTFDYTAERLGLEAPEELAVASPFDYRESTLLYVVDDIPEPNQPGYQRRLQDTLVELCGATRGRALVLFTSHAALQATYRAIKAPLEEQGVLVLAQRTDGSPRQLVDRLRFSPNVVVLGTSTFWEGVDVVGNALSLLVITKLPFAVPSDPVFAARSELFEQPFLEYAVPQAVLKFKQGFGRLIRSSRDRGVCAILDRRVISKRYGASFVQSLPDCTIDVGSAADLPYSAADWLR
ncbi:MAG: exonuclease domain-containing protein [Chloroflexota bacterium]|nr:exonuclease domain-containing protein [Chloroflexota bacterium]